MEGRLNIQFQPDDTACGPTCLHAVYSYWGDMVTLPRLVREIPRVRGGGTLAVMLACHALERGYRATLYTYNLHLFDPTWFAPPVPDLPRRLREQALIKDKGRIRVATQAYLRFLELGGELRFKDLTKQLLRGFIQRGLPVLAGLSSTYLYHAVREREEDGDDDDLGGKPTGHFVVLCGHEHGGLVRVADPYPQHPLADSPYYTVSMDRVLGAILLGVLTHDANFLIIRPRTKRE
ncbi:MAG: hypothetical protein Q8O14_07350 [bacterium]|nr:hypothetical protein [bacterium]